MGTFGDGGFTGFMGRKEVSGVVHGQEFVSDADTTADPANRAVLDWMHEGNSMANYGAEAGSRLGVAGFPNGGHVQPVYTPPTVNVVMQQSVSSPPVRGSSTKRAEPALVGLTDSTIEKLARTSSGYVRVQSRQGSI